MATFRPHLYSILKPVYSNLNFSVLAVVAIHGVSTRFVRFYEAASVSSALLICAHRHESTRLNKQHEFTQKTIADFVRTFSFVYLLINRVPPEPVAPGVSTLPATREVKTEGLPPFKP